MVGMKKPISVALDRNDNSQCSISGARWEQGVIQYSLY